MAKLEIHHTEVTPASKAKPLPHPPVGRDKQVLMPESGNNSVSLKADTFSPDVLAKNNVGRGPWNN